MHSGCALEPAINQSRHINLQPARPLQPRAIGTGLLSVRVDDSGHSRIRDLRQSGAMKLVFPRTFRPDLETILVNTAGGITGGDRFSLDIHVEPGAALTLTTQASERAYRAQQGEIGQVTTTLKVAAEAQLNWLPQELILFNHAALHRRQTFELAPTAHLLMVEPIVFGRAAMNEVVHELDFHDRIQITRAGRPLYLDGIRFCGDAAAHLARSAIANGAAAMASVVLVRADAGSCLSQVRAVLPQSAGASLIADDVLVIRLLAPDSFELRRSLIPILDYLSDNTLPISWRL